MRVLMNVNGQISVTMMTNHFGASGLDAAVTATPNDMMVEILKACKMDIVAYYAERVDNDGLLNFFKEIKAIDSNIHCILFIKKDNLDSLGKALENCFEECFTIPLNTIDLVTRLGQLARTIEYQNSQPKVPQQKPVEQKFQFSEQTYEQYLLPVNSQPQAKKAKDTKGKTKKEVLLKHLNKTELLEILYEQEKRLAELNDKL